MCTLHNVERLGTTGMEYKERQLKCSAFKHACKICRVTGHFESVCRRKNLNDTPAKNIADEIDSTADNAIFDTLCASKCDVTFTSSVCGKAKRQDSNKCNSITLNHHIYNNDQRRWESRPSDPQPTVVVSVAISNSAYHYFKIKPPPNSKTTTLKAIADTGCQSSLAGLNLLPKLGLTHHDLLRCNMSMKSASNKPITIHGALLLEISVLSHSGSRSCTKQMVYFSDQSDKFYLNRNACVQLGFISNKFPRSMYYFDSECKGFSHSISAFSALTSACSCPIRQKPHPSPQSYLFQA